MSKKTASLGVVLAISVVAFAFIYGKKKLSGLDNLAWALEDDFMLKSMVG